MAFELTDTDAYVKGVATGQWVQQCSPRRDQGPKTREALLRLWDETTETINAVADHSRGEISGRGRRVRRPGRPEFLLYFVDNEIHHGGAGVCLPPHWGSSRRVLRQGLKEVHGQSFSTWRTL
jgi:hypothetical protein